jgi:uncharacterized membrane protein
MAQQLVLSFFENEAAADEAVKQVKEWDKATREVKLGNVGILVKDDKGQIKTHKLGPRRTKTWAIGGAIAGVLSGGLTVVGGAVLGGILGSFSRKGLGIPKEDMARIEGELNNGRAAVVILAAHATEADFLTAKLAELGGTSETHEVADEVVEEAAAVAEEVAPEGAAPEGAAPEGATSEEAAPEEAAPETGEEPPPAV